ncbi:MAG TPA: nucleotidyltransferase domain-containing protein [Cytophagales bacterium]|nr:nucleotidyltransferase domain-containing protein [Cytophagales bacterium]
MKLIKKHKQELNSLCDKHKVKELYVFGSALTNLFNQDSDIDFLVKFGNVELPDYFDNYMDFKESLEKLFQREIDLVEVQTVKNPILKQSIDQTKIIVYERADSEVAV